MLLFAGLFLAPAAYSLDKTEDIDTNRNSFTYSTLVVPRASIQLENGATFSLLNNRQWTFNLPETQVRLGLTRKTEFQAFVPNEFLLQHMNSSETISRVSPIQEIGIKQQIGPLFTDEKKSPRLLRDFNCAIVAGVTPPTGSQLVFLQGTVGAVRVPWAKPVSKKYSLAGMQSLLFNGHVVQWQPTIMLVRSFGPEARTQVFAEYGGFFTTGQYPLNVAHFGAWRKLKRNQQVDVQVGFGMNSAAPIALFGVGYSFRFDRLNW